MRINCYSEKPQAYTTFRWPLYHSVYIILHCYSPCVVSNYVYLQVMMKLTAITIGVLLTLSKAHAYYTGTYIHAQVWQETAERLSNRGSTRFALLESIMELRIPLIFELLDWANPLSAWRVLLFLVFEDISQVDMNLLTFYFCSLCSPCSMLPF